MRQTRRAYRVVATRGDDQETSPAPLNDGSASTRLDFLAKALIAAGAVGLGGGLAVALPRLAVSAPSQDQDVEIFKFVLVLEYLQAAFYERAVSQGGLDGDLLEFAQVAAEHERAHVVLFENALGSETPERPTFDFGDRTRNPAAFGPAAVDLEDLVVSAYNGQGPNLTKAALAQAGRIVSVEARHAAWVRSIVGENPAPDATDEARNVAEAKAAMQQFGGGQ
jgi:hypothetical protein